MPHETRRAGAAACQGRTDGETQRDHSAPSVKFEALAQQVASCPPVQAKRLILRAKTRGEISLGQAQALFNSRPELVTA